MVFPEIGFAPTHVEQRDALMRLVGKDTTEVTTSSTTFVQGSSVTGLSIPAAAPFLISFSMRKDAGGAGDVGFQVEINNTVVHANSVLNSANAAHSLVIHAFAQPRATNYLRGMHFVRSETSGGAGLDIANTADLPTGGITRIDVNIKSNNGAITTGVKDLFVYQLPTIVS